MKVLMQICLQKGLEVSGSDANLKGHCIENVIGADLVVYSLAIDQNNCELIYAKQNGIKTMSRSQFLGEIAKDYECVIAVAGSHGKTTVTGMLWQIFEHLNPTVHIGGRYKGSCGRVGGKEIFITEACEYKRAFLDLRPEISAVLNVDLDHTDCYKDLGSLQDAFSNFEKNSKRVIKDLKINGNKGYTAKNLKSQKGKYSFDLYFDKKNLGRIFLKCYGKHNVENALYAGAISLEYGLTFDRVKAGLENFFGVDRRFEFLGKVNNKDFYTDYAHHPKEITATINTVKKSGYKKALILFEPHTFSRTEYFFKGFVSSLKKCKEVVILPIFAAREIGTDCAKELAKKISKGTKCHYAKDYKIAKEIIKQSSCNAVIFVGAGKIDDEARKIVEQLIKEENNPKSCR